jgi:hypothetical protein
VVFLPIVERELRVAARKRSTFWVRLAAALVALVIGSGCLVLNEVGAAWFGGPALGKALFAMLTWLSLGVALSAGLFFTSDCLSEEKREGTMGFLLVTGLRGYDVVLGKLLATSLRGFHAFLAVFPILAVTLLMGGVTAAQFWKTTLALVNALLVSLAAGLFVSVLSRHSQRAMGATLLLLLLVFGGPVGDALFAASSQGSRAPLLSLSSPGYLFVLASTWARAPFWLALLINQAVAWTLLGLTCLLLPRTWQERTFKTSTAAGSWAHRWKFGRPKRRELLRRKLLALDPAVWLAVRERWQAATVWVMAIVLAGGFVALFAGTDDPMAWPLWSFVAGSVTLLLYLGIAAQAGRFFVEARRSRLFELLLATPLTEKQIVQGQWRALLRIFGLPVLVCLAAQFLGAVLLQQMMWNQLASATARAAATPPPTATSVVSFQTTIVPPATLVPAPPAAATPTNLPATPATSSAVVMRAGPAATTTTFSLLGITAPGVLVALFISLGATLAVAANLVALSWFGMWMGLNSKNTNLATLKTILFVQVIPWFAMSYASALLGGLLLISTLAKGGPSSAPRLMVWSPLLASTVGTVLALGKDIGFVLWARHKLFSQFRERAAQAMAPIGLHVPLLPRPDAPPLAEKPLIRLVPPP